MLRIRLEFEGGVKAHISCRSILAHILGYTHTSSLMAGYLL
uniref:Uncharacterized protein n=1 Tax=Arundo donax TaxID=35708 RepID=A0A0A9C878_ARUDO